MPTCQRSACLPKSVRIPHRQSCHEPEPCDAVKQQCCVQWRIRVALLSGVVSDVSASATFKVQCCRFEGGTYIADTRARCCDPAGPTFARALLILLCLQAVLEIQVVQLQQFTRRRSPQSTEVPQM